MSVYKQLTTADTIVTPFTVNKTFTIEGKSNFADSNINIDTLVGEREVISLFESSSATPTGNYNNQYTNLVFRSIRQLYYTNYKTQSFGDNAVTASFIESDLDESEVILGPPNTTNYDNYLSNTLTQSRTINLHPSMGVISVPKSMFGEYIQPGSFTFTSHNVTFQDDKNGNIYVEDSGDKYNVGNIIYEHGMVVLNYKPNTPSFLTFTPSASVSIENLTCSFDSTKTIYEAQYLCNLNEAEYNFSLNPTIISGSDGAPYDFATGSYFNPFITSVGLYNNSHDLIAVAKLGQPIPKSDINDTNIVINLDMF